MGAGGREEFMCFTLHDAIINTRSQQGKTFTDGFSDLEKRIFIQEEVARELLLVLDGDGEVEPSTFSVLYLMQVEGAYQGTTSATLISQITRILEETKAVQQRSNQLNIPA